VALFTLYRSRGKRPEYVIHISAPAIQPVNNRPDWCLDFVAAGPQDHVKLPH
jgi:hypothetical protein